MISGTLQSQRERIIYCVSSQPLVIGKLLKSVHGGFRYVRLEKIEKVGI
jgi:hypothetical protein